MDFIVAVSKNWGIGYKGGLLASIPEDMKHFRETTKDAVVVMGRSTLLSFPSGRPLKGRINIVMSRDVNYKVDGATVVHSIEEALREAEKYDRPAFIIGGADIYTSFLPYCRYGYVTKMDFSPAADRFIPNLDNDDNWFVESREPAGENNGISYQFLRYENRHVKRDI